MFGNKRWAAAAMAVGLIALAALIGCGGEESVASKSAAAFKEAQKKGETFEGEGHAHGGHGDHSAEAVPQQPATGEDHHAGHGATGGESPVDHSAMGHGAGAHAGGHAPRRSGSTQSEAAGAGHAGHGAPSAQPSGGHAGHSPSGTAASGTPSAQAPAPELPTQPASILRPDPLDSPAATSVVDAQRSAEMNRQMSGGHGSHGAGTYRHIDAGRGPGAHEGSEPQPPGAEPQQHDHDHGAAAENANLYVCPMHPEVTSKTPGACPKCGMALVERREE